jgi:predicted nuclease of predicted toxin-antitoxin system
VNFLLDAQLPRRLAFLLRESGHDVIHTLDLPHANRTTDHEINNRSVQELRVVVTKDSDFVDSLLLRRQPWKLLSVTTGNIHNREFEALFLTNLETIINGLEEHTYVELSRFRLSRPFRPQGYGAY